MLLLGLFIVLIISWNVIHFRVHHYQWLNPIVLEPSRDFLYLEGLAVAVTIVTDFHLFISEFWLLPVSKILYHTSKSIIALATTRK